MFEKKKGTISFDDYKEEDDEYEDMDDDDLKVAMINNIYSNAIKLTEIAAANDRSVDTKEKVFKTYKKSFEIVIESMTETPF